MVKKEKLLIAIIGFMILIGIPINAFAETVHMNTLTGGTTGQYTLSGCTTDNQIFVGEEITTTSALKGVTINKIGMKIMGTDAGVGALDFGENINFYIGVWDSSVQPTGSNVKTLFHVARQDTLPRTSTQLNFTISSGYTLQSGDIIGVYYQNRPNSNTIGGINSCLHNGNMSPQNVIAKVLPEYRTTDGFNSTSTFLSFFTLNTVGTGTWTDQTNQDVRLLVISGAVIPSGGGIDCSNPINQNILTCRLQTIGATPLAGASQLTNQSATDISCQIGLIACTGGVPDDTNIQTNGIGYILLFVALGIWVGLLWVASRGQITEIPNFVWMIGTIAVVGAVTVVDWIDPTILIVSIITVIALAGIKAKNIFSGVGGMFKGEES